MACLVSMVNLVSMAYYDFMVCLVDNLSLLTSMAVSVAYMLFFMAYLCRISALCSFNVCKDTFNLTDLLLSSG